MMWEGESNVTQRFRTVAETTKNPVYREMAEHITNRTLQGTAISEYFNGYYYLMGNDFASVIHTVDQNPAQGPAQLYRYARSLEEKASEQLDVTIALLEQFAIFIPLGFVLFILLASYLPLIEAVGRLSSK
jgi:type II secretory pathway component PulF